MWKYYDLKIMGNHVESCSIKGVGGFYVKKEVELC